MYKERNEQLKAA
jgi:hypothetical protein